MTGPEILARHSATFSRAAGWLPADAREDVAAVYAFCRAVDDTVDEATSRHEASLTLDAVDHALDDLERRPILDDPSDADCPEVVRTAVPAFLDVCRRRHVSVRLAHELVAGCRSDLDPVRIPDDEALLAYAWRVAGTVGLMCAPILGAEAGSATYAESLGIAMQITNICRDVAEDAARGRVYLPASRLRAAGVDPETIVLGRADPAVVATVVLDLLDLADEHYAHARSGYPFLPARTRLGVVVAANLYRAIGGVLRRRNGDSLSGRAVVTPMEKAWIVAASLAEWSSVG